MIIPVSSRSPCIIFWMLKALISILHGRRISTRRDGHRGIRIAITDSDLTISIYMITSRMRRLFPILLLSLLAACAVYLAAAGIDPASGIYSGRKTKSGKAYKAALRGELAQYAVGFIE